MLCDKPITVFSNPQAFLWTPNPEGKFGEYRTFGCGRCVKCRWLVTRQWALRCALEATTHKKSCFLTLTYRDEALPKKSSLVVGDLQKFVKRLRRHVDYHHGIRIRYYGAGEYGSTCPKHSRASYSEKKDCPDCGGIFRPHYHIVIFGYDFPDQYYWRTSERGFKLFRSDEAEALWPFGFVEIGAVTFKSAGYVAGYIRKKVNGKKADDYYQGRVPEFSIMSKKPPIGYEWLKQNQWVWRDDMIRSGGKSFRPPFAFEMIFKKEDPEGYDAWVRDVKSLRAAVDVRGDDVDSFADESNLDLLDEDNDSAEEFFDL